MVAIKAYSPYTDETLAAETVDEPILVDDYDGGDMWFEVDVLLGIDDEDAVERYAMYDEQNLRWELGGV